VQSGPHAGRFAQKLLSLLQACSLQQTQQLKLSDRRRREQ